MNRVAKILICALVMAIATPTSTQQLYAQNSSSIEKQKRVIADLERKIRNDEQQIKALKKNKNSTQASISKLARQISDRQRLLDTKEREISRLTKERDKAENESRTLNRQLQGEKNSYGQMAREAYRNYRHNNYLVYIFSSSDVADMTRRMANMRNVAKLRHVKVQNINTLQDKVAKEKAEIERQNAALSKEKRKLSSEQSKMQRDQSNAKKRVAQLSDKERQVLRQKAAQEQKLSVALSELRRLSKGNQTGKSFSKSTQNLRLPVVGGNVKRYKGNMAEITGPRGARVISIYEGKVVDVKRNKITNKYDVFVAHGEYITSYANLNSVSVSRGSIVQRNGTIGEVGNSVDIDTMEPEYKIIFGIYPPSSSITMSAADCFK